jgi:glycosyltransferase involved in cell wall biosynthesis
VSDGVSDVLTVLVCLNNTTVGGSQLVAVDAAADMRERGHRVLVFGPPGPLSSTFAERGLEWFPAPPGSRPSPSGVSRHREPSAGMANAIRRLVREHRVDVVHAYEWVRSLEAMCGAHLVSGTPLVTSVLSITLPKFIPRSSHLVVGAAEMAETARARGYPDVSLIEPPTWTPRPTTPAELATFREHHGVTDGVPVVLIASRLANEKVESIEMAIDAVASIADHRPVQLLVAGEGTGEYALRDRGESVNRRLGQRAVIFTGLLHDVAPAYAVADVVIGMGTSVRRGMAMGKPAVLVGQQGFAQLMDEEHGPAIAAAGFWGRGSTYGASQLLADHLSDALSSPARMAELSASSLAIEAARPTRSAAAARLEEIYFGAVARPPSLHRRTVAAAQSLGRLGGMRARSWARRRLFKRGVRG